VQDKAHKYDNFNPVLFDLLPAGAKVLDVGCGGGILMSRLHAEKACRVIGLDGDLKLVALCKKRGLDVRLVNLESPPKKLPAGGPFDAIVLGDVLEHLRDPGPALTWLKGALAPEGRIWVSLPNVAFASVRLQLVLGRFDYNPEGGILDEGHLRLYTAKSGRAMLEAAGYHVEGMRSCNIVRTRYAFLKYLGVLWPELFSIQLIFEARPS
jgi:SAM-dependent methyltransferase